MTSTTPANLPNQNDDEIDLGQLVGSLRRQWKLIGGVTLATVLVSALYTFSRKPTWEGRFDIVLKQAEGNSSMKAQLLASNPALGAFIGGGGGASELETQVEILNSTSVLNPIFQYVRAEKPSSQTKSLSFDDWKKSALDIKLKKGTSVLNVAYRDNDEELVLPVLQRLSRAYQSYSGKDRRRGLGQGINYLSRQLEIYRQRALEALKAAQNYAIANDLTAVNDETIKSDLNLDLQRAGAAARVRSLKQQIGLLNQSANTVLYQGLSVPALTGQTSLFAELKGVESSLAKQSVRFTDQDETIQKLKEQRKLLIGYINRETADVLKAQLVAAEAELGAATRPKGVLLKFRDLQRVAAREEGTLLKLEETYRGLQLEAARQEDPWELISTPTLLDKPVAPKKSQALALGLLAGLVMGSGAALVADRRKGLVWSEEELQQLLGLPVLVRLNGANNDDIELLNSLEPLVQGPLAGSGKVAVLSSSERETPIAIAMGQQLGQRMHWLRLNEPVALKQTRECDQLLIQLDLGRCKREELQQLRQQLKLLNIQPLGIILVG
jgi:hypothetical protein